MKLFLVIFSGLLLVFLFFAGSLLGMLGVLALTVFGLVRSPAKAFVGIGLLPLLTALLSFSSGVVGFLRGTAHYRTVGLPVWNYDNLNPRTRVSRETSGCMVSGLEFLTHHPNNAAIELMSSWMGPMPGSYLGPYPEQDEARAMVTRDGRVISREGLLKLANGDELQDVVRYTFDDSAPSFRILELAQGGLLISGERNWGDALVPAVALVDVNRQRSVARWMFPPKRADD